MLAGHGRLTAAMEMGLTQVPVVEITHMTEAEKRAYIIADNSLSEQSSWSKETLWGELNDLANFGFELELTGFDTIEIDKLLSFDDPEPHVGDDVHLPDEEDPICRVGELWQIGVHRLAVGDVRDPRVYERLMEGQRAQRLCQTNAAQCASRG